MIICCCVFRNTKRNAVINACIASTPGAMKKFFAKMLLLTWRARASGPSLNALFALNVFLNWTKRSVVVSSSKNFRKTIISTFLSKLTCYTLLKFVFVSAEEIIDELKPIPCFSHL